jgi:tetratricopeptide (TPR) repeat protein
MKGTFRLARNHLARLTILLFALSIPSFTLPGQVEIESPRPAPGLGIRIHALPMDLAHRDSLENAVKGRNFELAEKILMTDIEGNPKSQPVLTLLGDIFFLDGKYLDSAIAMKKAQALGPLDNRSRFTLAMAYVILEKGAWARPELEALAKSDPRNALYPYWLSRLDYSDMSLNSAVENVKKAIELDPTFMKAYDNLGLYYDALGKSEEAIHAYQDAIRLNHQRHLHSPWPSMNLGAVLIKSGRLDEAEPYLKESLTESPRFPKAHFQLGILLEKKKRYKEAVEELKQAAEFDETYPEPYFVLGRLYHRLGDEKSAQEAFRMFQERNQKEKEKNVRRLH